MAESFGAGGPSGSSGVLSSTLRSIVRQAGDPQDHEQRRVQDVVDLSPMAAQQRQTQEKVQPTEPADTLRNPGGQANTLARARAENASEEAEAAAREAEQRSEPVTATSRPVNIGLAAAIAIGSSEMVDRYDINGDEHLDQRERERAIDSVTSEESQRQAQVGRMFRPSGGEAAESDGNAGEAYYAEMEAKKAEAAQARAEAQAKAEQSRADRLAALDAQQQAQASGAERAYERSEDLDARTPPPRDLKA